MIDRAMHEMTPHREEACQKMTSIGQRFFGMIEYDDNEEFLLEIRKHPFGLFLIQILGFIVSVLLGIIPIAIAFNLNFFQIADGTNTSAIKAILIFTGLVLSLLAFGATFITALIYKYDVIYVTNEKVAQVLYTSIFSRKLTQLGIGEVQDVSVSQSGIFPRLFDYGTLTIESAGEQQNYTFTYVPHPYPSSRTIVMAHEDNVHKYGN